MVKLCKKESRFTSKKASSKTISTDRKAKNREEPV